MKDFDYRYTNDTIQIIKAAGLFVPPKEQNYLALIIKIMELKLIIEKIQRRNKGGFKEDENNAPRPDIDTIFCDLKEKIHKESADKLDSFYQIYKAYEMYQQVKDLMDVLGPDALSSFMNFGDNNSFDLSSFFTSGKNN